MRSLFRLIAIVLLSIFVLLFPLSLLMRNAGQLLFDPEVTRQLIEEQFLDGNSLSDSIQHTVRTVINDQSGNDSDYGPLIGKALGELGEEDWNEITQLVAPNPLVLSTADEMLTSFVEWLDSEEPLPDLQVNLQPWKRNINQNAEEILVILLEALPDCTFEELSSQFLDGLFEEGSLSAAIPACKPGEPIYSNLIANSGKLVSSMSERMPQQIDISSLQIDGIDRIEQAKQILIQVRDTLRWPWLILLGMALLALLMVVRTRQLFFRWAGWPALLSGIGTLMLGFSLGFLEEDAIARLIGRFIQGAPSAMGSIVAGIVTGLSESLSRTLTVQGTVLLLLGIALLAGSRFLDRSEPL